jgi:hypothetical protein
MMHAIQHLARRIGLALAAMLLTLALWEAACFVWPAKHQMDNPWYTMVGDDALSASTDLPFERPPHFTWTGSSRGDLAVIFGDRDPYAKTVTFKTDFQGFRNDTDIREADIVFIGDSYIEAGNVDFDKGMAQLVRARLGRSVRNLCRAVYAPPHELVVLKKYGLACKPKLVVWQIAESNDLDESVKFERWRQSGKPFFESTGLGRSTRRDTWRKRSPTQLLLSLFKAPKPYPIAGTFKARDGRDYRIRFLPQFPGRSQTPRVHPGKQVMGAAMKAGADLLKELKIPLLIIVIPMKFHVLGDHIEPTQLTREHMAGYQPIPQKERLPEQMRQYCEILNVPYVDATAALRAATAEGELVYIPFDTHLNDRGHEIVADLIVDAIQNQESGVPAAPPNL